VCVQDFTENESRDGFGRRWVLGQGRPIAPAVMQPRLVMTVSCKRTLTIGSRGRPQTPDPPRLVPWPAKHLGALDDATAYPESSASMTPSTRDPGGHAQRRASARGTSGVGVGLLARAAFERERSAAERMWGERVKGEARGLTRVRRLRRLLTRYPPPLL
jgi:hypothetical protein